MLLGLRAIAGEGVVLADEPRIVGGEDLPQRPASGCSAPVRAASAASSAKSTRSWYCHSSVSLRVSDGSAAMLAAFPPNRRPCLRPSPPRANGESSAMMGGMRYDEPLVAPNGDRFVLIEFGDDAIAYCAFTNPALDTLALTVLRHFFVRWAIDRSGGAANTIGASTLTLYAYWRC